MSSTSSRSQTNTAEINLVEWGLLLFFILAVTYWGYRYAPGTKYWDDLLYIHTAWNMDALPHILNRYWTMYLLRIFNSIAGGDPILGAQYFGAFTSSTIIALVYLNARILARTAQLFYALLAVLFFLSFEHFTNDFGAVLADYTVTMMTLAGVFVFNWFWRIPARRKVLLILFGLILFLSLKSKETGIILCVLIPGFFLDTGEHLTVKEMILRLGFILSGYILGLLVFVLLNGIFLKEILFGLRPSDFRELIAFNTGNRGNLQDVKANFLYYIASNGVFLLSLVWMFKSEDEFKNHNRWLWLSVLGIIPFLNITTANGAWELVPRYLTPAVAILSILAPQVIPLEMPLSLQSHKLYLTLFTAASLLASGAVFYIAFMTIARKEHWGFEYFAVGIVAPIMLCLLIFWLSFKKNHGLLSTALLVTLIGTLVVPIAIRRVSKLLAHPSEPYSRFMPFAEFRRDVTCDHGTVLISGTIYAEHQVLSRNLSSSRWLYNLFFRCHMTSDQFDYSETQEDLVTDLSRNDYQYAFLDATDYEYLVSQPEQSDKIFDRYSVKFDEGQLYYLLTINP